MNTIGKWIMNVLISIDQFGNTVFGGDPDETISSRLGKMKKKHGGSIPWYRPLSKIIAWGCNQVDTDHCEDAIENDEGKDALIDK